MPDLQPLSSTFPLAARFDGLRLFFPYAPGQGNPDGVIRTLPNLCTLTYLPNHSNPYCIKMEEKAYLSIFLINSTLMLRSSFGKHFFHINRNYLH